MPDPSPTVGLSACSAQTAAVAVQSLSPGHWRAGGSTTEPPELIHSAHSSPAPLPGLHHSSRPASQGRIRPRKLQHLMGSCTRASEPCPIPSRAAGPSLPPAPSCSINHPDLGSWKKQHGASVGLSDEPARCSNTGKRIWSSQAHSHPHTSVLQQDQRTLLKQCHVTC